MGSKTQLFKGSSKEGCRVKDDRARESPSFRFRPRPCSRPATKACKLSNSSPVSLHTPRLAADASDNDQGGGGRNQFAIYQGTRALKVHSVTVSRARDVGADKGARSTLNRGEDGAEMKGGHGCSRVMHQGKKDDAEREDPAP